jgi:hypothetical protein
MSTNGHESHGAHMKNGEPFHETVTFEPRDINVATVAKQLVYLAITIVLALVICVPILNFLTKVAAEGDTPMAPIRAGMHMDDCKDPDGAFPPEPRLQGVPCHENDPQLDMRNKIAEDEAENASSGWVDKAGGVARIPVKAAMDLLVQKAAAAAPQEKK